MRVAEKIELDAVTERELRVLSKRRRVEARLGPRFGEDSIACLEACPRRPQHDRAD
jgi:hypothetical protein